MAINIQEILHPSDSDSIKFSKINYNFDQILANGGGPIGPKGQKGIQGVVGQTGQKGEIGEKGIKGDSGETTSPWKSIAIDLDALDGVNNVTILKPKPGTDKETPTIWLGDSSFINDGNTAGDGDVSLRSTLNVGRHYNFSNSAVEAEYITLWHDADNKIKIDSENQTGYVRYNISPVQPLVGNAPDIRLQINTPTVHTETFQLNNQSASGTLSSGMIRYNSGGQKFEGYINNAWVEFCMDPCGSATPASISISPSGDISANADGTPSGDSISISPSGDVNAEADGSPAGSLPAPVITNFDAYPVTGSSTEIECYWDSISDSTDVTITWGTGGSFTNVGSYTVTNYGSDTYTITGLTASTAYSIRMTATNATGDDVEERTATTEAAVNEQQYTIQFDGTTLGINTWEIDSMLLNPSYAGSANNPSFSYNTSTRVGTLTAVDGDTLRFSITASAGTGRQFTTPQGGTFTVSGAGTEVSEQVQQGNLDASIEVEVVVGASLSVSVGLEASTIPYIHTVTYVNGGNTANAITLCNATGLTQYTAEYTGNSAGNWSIIQNAIMNDNDYSGGTGPGFTKVVSSTESGFTWSDHTFNHNAPGYPTNCSSLTYVGDEWNFTNNTGTTLYFTFWNTVNGTMTTDSPLGSGQTRTKCHWEGAPQDPYWSDSSGNPQTINYNVSISNSNTPC